MYQGQQQMLVNNIPSIQLQSITDNSNMRSHSASSIRFNPVLSNSRVRSSTPLIQPNNAISPLKPAISEAIEQQAIDPNFIQRIEEMSQNLEESVRMRRSQPDIEVNFEI
jgi:hypothetical protein